MELRTHVHSKLKETLLLLLLLLVLLNFSKIFHFIENEKEKKTFFIKLHNILFIISIDWNELYIHMFCLKLYLKGNFV